MPKLSIFFIRTSLIYFMAGITIGAIMLAEKGLPSGSSIWAYRSAHIEFTLFGWMVQLVMGTAYWILPRHPAGPPRGNPAAAWLSFALLNTGLLMGVATVWLIKNPGLEAFFRMIQLAGIGCFVYVIWPRVLTFRKER
ncbi:MAG: cbb3-type cytochrome c oxidase subunit I [Balneolales bacterium]